MPRHRAADERVELHRRLQVTTLEQRRLRQPRPIRQHPPAAHRSAEQHRRTAGAVIGPAGTVNCDSPPEFGRDQHHGVAPQRPETGLQSADHRVEALQLRTEPLALPGVRVPPARFNHRDPRAVGGHHQLRRKSTGRRRIGTPARRQITGQRARVHRLAPQRVELAVALIQHRHALEQIVRGSRQVRRRVGRHIMLAAQGERDGRRYRDRLCLGRRQHAEQAIEPAVFLLIRAVATALEHVLPVEMRAVAIRRGDGVCEQRLALAVQCAQRRHRRMQREHPVEPRGPGKILRQHAARSRKCRIADRCDDPHPVGGTALDDEDEAPVGFRLGKRHAGGEREGQRACGTGPDKGSTVKDWGVHDLISAGIQARPVAGQGPAPGFRNWRSRSRWRG